MCEYVEGRDLGNAFWCSDKTHANQKPEQQSQKKWLDVQIATHAHVSTLSGVGIQEKQQKTTTKKLKHTAFKQKSYKEEASDSPPVKWIEWIGEPRHHLMPPQILPWHASSL